MNPWFVGSPTDSDTHALVAFELIGTHPIPHIRTQYSPLNEPPTTIVSKTPVLPNLDPIWLIDERAL